MKRINNFSKLLSSLKIVDNIAIPTTEEHQKFPITISNLPYLSPNLLVEFNEVIKRYNQQLSWQSFLHQVSLLLLAHYQSNEVSKIH